MRDRVSAGWVLLPVLVCWCVGGALAQQETVATATPHAATMPAEDCRYTRLRVERIEQGFTFLRFQMQFHAAEEAGVKHIVLLVDANESDPGESVAMARWLSRAANRAGGPSVTALVKRADVGSMMVALACSRVYMLPDATVQVAATMEEEPFQRGGSSGGQFEQRKAKLLAAIRESRAKQQFRDNLVYTSGHIYQMGLIGGSCRTMSDLRAAVGVADWVEEPALDLDAGEQGGLVVRERAPEVEEAKATEAEREAARRYSPTPQQQSAASNGNSAADRAREIERRYDQMRTIPGTSRRRELSPVERQLLDREIWNTTH